MTKYKEDALETKYQFAPSRTINKVLMVSPDSFSFNPETASTNAFQNKTETLGEEVKKQAMFEFNQMVKTLRAAGILVFVSPSRKDIKTPDAVFPNNWISTHENNQVVIYPMFAKNRRSERQWGKIKNLLGVSDKTVVHDLSYLENEGFFLEGTGSLVFDRKNKIVFATESARTSIKALSVFCKIMKYEPILFHATSENRKPIYHTNVVMSIGDGFAVVCLEAIENNHERKIIADKISELELEKIEITRNQMQNFCGNILELQSRSGRNKIIISKTALNFFSEKQKKTLRKYGDLVSVNIPTIERVGGGSARCLLTELFLTSISIPR